MIVDAVNAKRRPWDEPVADPEQSQRRWTGRLERTATGRVARGDYRDAIEGGPDDVKVVAEIRS